MSHPSHRALLIINTPTSSSSSSSSTHIALAETSLRSLTTHTDGGDTGRGPEPGGRPEGRGCKEEQTVRTSSGTRGGSRQAR
eukprot:764096-Hanusia_phi.AAC.5